MWPEAGSNSLHQKTIFKLLGSGQRERFDFTEMIFPNDIILSLFYFGVEHFTICNGITEM